GDLQELLPVDRAGQIGLDGRLVDVEIGDQRARLLQLRIPHLAEKHHARPRTLDFLLVARRALIEREVASEHADQRCRVRAWPPCWITCAISWASTTCPSRCSARPASTVRATWLAKV